MSMRTVVILFFFLFLGSVIPDWKIDLRHLRRCILRSDANLRGWNSEQRNPWTFARLFPTPSQLWRDVRFLRGSCNRRAKICMEVYIHERLIFKLLWCLCVNYYAYTGDVVNCTTKMEMKNMRKLCLKMSHFNLSRQISGKMSVWRKSCPMSRE